MRLKSLILFLHPQIIYISDIVLLVIFKVILISNNTFFLEIIKFFPWKCLLVKILFRHVHERLKLCYRCIVD